MAAPSGAGPPEIVAQATDPPAIAPHGADPQVAAPPAAGPPEIVAQTTDPPVNGRNSLMQV